MNCCMGWMLNFGVGHWQCLFQLGKKKILESIDAFKNLFKEKLACYD